MKLLIVESPNKIRKIKEILGAGWEIAASVGHIRDLPVKELGIAMPGYQPQYELSGRGADVVKTLRARAAKAEHVYLATDPDREGEAIAWHLSEALKLKSPRRVTFDAITPEVIRRAVEQPRSVDLDLVHAQEARRVLDRLFGYQVSPMLSRQTGQRGLSAGRVQSPAVRLVVEREREIDAFVEVRHFGAELQFDDNAWRAQWETAPFLKKDEKYVLDESLAQRAAACRACSVLSSSNRIAKQPPPPPFTTSTLLQAASIRLRWKPDMTAQVAQRLFEAGLITYHRTDSQNFSAEGLKEVRAYAKSHDLPLPASARSFRSKSNAQEAHEAIRPTHFASEHAGDDPAQQQLYRLIWFRAVASQLSDAEWSVNTTRLQSKSADEVFTFKAEGRVLTVPGWKSLTARDDSDEEEEDAKDNGDGRVPILSVGTQVTAEDGRVLYKKTQPPPRYTQATLIKKLESIGIGRPSTYAAILKNVQTRGYLEDDKKYLRPTSTGNLVVDTLTTRFSFVEYEFTRALEQQLDDIAEGKAKYLTVVSTADEQLQRELAALQSSPRAPYNPGNAQVSRFNNSSSYRKDSGAWRASDRLATPRPAGAPEPRATASQPSTGSPANRTAKKPGAAAKRTATASSSPKTTKPRRKTASPQPELRPEPAQSPARQQKEAPLPAIPCPVCKAGFLRLAREDAKFYGCSAYSDGCRFLVWRTVAGRTLKPLEIAALCRDGRTEKLSGFMSKAGRPFEAALVLTPEGKVEFSFQPRP